MSAPSPMPGVFEVVCLECERPSLFVATPPTRITGPCQHCGTILNIDLFGQSAPLVTRGNNAVHIDDDFDTQT